MVLINYATSFLKLIDNKTNYINVYLEDSINMGQDENGGMRENATKIYLTCMGHNVTADLTTLEAYEMVFNEASQPNAQIEFKYLQIVALNVLNERYELAMDTILGNTPKKEVDTWTKQEEEAKAWAADNKAPTPYIDAVLSTRSDITKEIFIQKVLEKSNSFLVESGETMGRFQVLRARLENATKLSELQDILNS